MRAGSFVAALLLVPALAAAEQRTQPAGTAPAYGDVVLSPASIDDLRFGRQVLPPATPTDGGGVSAVAQSNIIYLNKNGVTLQPGLNDSRTNRSTMAAQTTTIGPWTGVSPATWTATVSCMKELFQPFAVTIVDTDPGNVPHMEAVFGGSPTQLGLPNNVAGVSPFTTDCAVIENSIVFTFTNVIPQDARLACEIMAQEVAHSYGLDHELLASDPMTYLMYTGNRSFKNQMASCGEDVTRPCGIAGSTCRPNQNSVSLLTERLGARGGDVTPPTGAITSPGANALVPPGFKVYANAADNMMVRSGKLYVDGTLVDTITSGGPFTFSTATTLPEGLHRLKIEISDGVNVMTTTEITVTVKAGAPPPPAPGGDASAPDAEVTGGCSTGGGTTGLGLALALLGLLRRRATKPRCSPASNVDTSAPSATS